MSKPRHRRCPICNRVTHRYSHTENAGAFVIKVWVRDPIAARGRGSRDFCVDHVPAEEAS